MNLKVQDYYPSGKRFFLRFKEKGGKEKELPVHPKLEELLDEYLKAAASTASGKNEANNAGGNPACLSRRRAVVRSFTA